MNYKFAGNISINRWRPLTRPLWTAFRWVGKWVLPYEWELVSWFLPPTNVVRMEEKHLHRCLGHDRNPGGRTRKALGKQRATSRVLRTSRYISSGP